MGMLSVLVIVLVVVALSVLMLGVNIFLFRRSFPETEVGKNKHMIRLGLRCPQCEERMRYRKTTVRPASVNIKSLHPDWSKLVPNS